MKKRIGNVKVYPDIKEFFSYFFNLMNQETTRGAAIVGMALLEENLDSLLRKRLVGNPDIDKYSMTIKKKIDLSFLTGAISKEMRVDLNILNGIRNDFAHYADIDDDKVQKKISRLVFFKDRDYQGKSFKDILVWAIAFYLSLLKFQECACQTIKQDDLFKRLFGKKKVSIVSNPWADSVKD